MNIKDYVANAIVTETRKHGEIERRLGSDQLQRALHSAMGMSTEANEVLDALKKAVFYGKDLDIINIYEELGDLMWYIAIMCDTWGFDLENIMEMNIKKLKARYPEKFDEERANTRDLRKERKVLEGE